MNPLFRLRDFGQSPWLDYIRRGLITSGGLKRLVEEFAVVDRSGRLQIPREHIEELGIEERARVELVDDHVEVRPERRPDRQAPPWSRR